jgi:NAD/NADP transhydrogenase alpha subunit
LPACRRSPPPAGWARASPLSATDVRPAAKEQVASLGAKFIAVEDEEFKAAETAGGYAKQMSEAYQAKQAALVAEHIAKQDIVITTALIPGRPAPRLVTRAMLASMKPGSVAVDLAVERGGNIEGSVKGSITTVEGVKVVGYANVPGRVAASASALYAKNLFAFPGDDGLQGDEGVRGQSRRRTGQGDHADPWRPGRSPRFRRSCGGVHRIRTGCGRSSGSACRKTGAQAGPGDHPGTGRPDIREAEADAQEGGLGYA